MFKNDILNTSEDEESIYENSDSELSQNESDIESDEETEDVVEEIEDIEEEIEDVEEENEDVEEENEDVLSEGDNELEDNINIIEDDEIIVVNKVNKRNKLKFNKINIVEYKKKLLFNFLEEDNIREKCKLILKDYCKTNRNLILIEKCIYEISSNKENYICNVIYFYGMIKKNEINLMDLYQELKDNIIKYKSIVYNNEKEKILYEVNLLKEPIKVVEGIYKCDKCGDKKTYNYSVQTRRADEPPTVFIHCTNKLCKFVKRMN